MLCRECCSLLQQQQPDALMDSAQVRLGTHLWSSLAMCATLLAQALVSRLASNSVSCPSSPLVSFAWHTTACSESTTPTTLPLCDMAALRCKPSSSRQHNEHLLCLRRGRPPVAPRAWSACRERASISVPCSRVFPFQVPPGSVLSLGTACAGASLCWRSRPGQLGRRGCPSQR